MEQQSDQAHPNCTETIQTLAEVEKPEVELEEQVPVGEEDKGPQEVTSSEQLDEGQKDEAQKMGNVDVIPEKNKEQEAPEQSNDVGKGEEVMAESVIPETKPEEDDPPVAAGSLAFAFLQDEQTKGVLRESRTLFILRGLPGSGKTHLATAIKDVYEGVCSVVSAEEIAKPENDASGEGHKALDEAIQARFMSGTPVVVVDDANHTHDRLAWLGQHAGLHLYCTLFLEPLTEWRRDPERLVQKSKQGLEKDEIQALKIMLEETSIPLFFGWFLVLKSQERMNTMKVDFLKTLVSLDAFKNHASDYNGGVEKEVNLEEYFHHEGVFHCTTKFCDYGKAEGAKEYAEKQSVKESYGRVSELVLNTLFVTPRTLGARVSLAEDQLQLWPSDTDQDARSGIDIARGSHAHITLGCAEGVEPVQTGLDLLELVQVEQESHTGDVVQDLELGSLTYYGKGMWALSLREPFLATACFSSYYGHWEEKETEKKRSKCTVH
ncbi:2',3'-cyclic-nucleotide 3'-phosphodiesterase-like [Brienomyrus brachyistius]|uniref:2',3'-cyclic-nucleotide 3'-phosphodiesterase-like n=1 Tax=Brienomyrus brachyistius TaxID=42636 RepID=UPI0020B39E79|nr:2',3'-cyclic-nucleotide 3'-phosphodiesterase-like [Brienomyrus brachyistius]XP_048870803.1 2',3'-cyclic-nucleotide 3'-phosphodiesterase-like [Brienomyrus brachyistius]